MSQPPRPIRSSLVLPEGLEAGLLGGLAVALVFFARDLASGEPIYTPSVLGTLVLRGVEAAREVRSAPGEAAAYHTLHFAVWVVLGFLASGLAGRAEGSPSLRGLVWACFAGALLVLVGLDFWVAETGIGRQHLWTGGLAGLASMAGFLVWRHPILLGSRGE
jgi:hypothetical protein